MLTKLFINLGIKRINPDTIDSWISENRTDFIIAVLRKKKSSQRVVILRSLNSEMYLAGLAFDLIK